MKASGDDAPPAGDRNEGWDETVLVWNATVARIPAPGAQASSGPDGDCDGAERSAPTTRRAGAKPARRSSP